VVTVEKMSKSLNNVINPDDVVAEYGADTLRLYEMFMGPLEVVKPWNMRDVAGVHRFLNRVWRLAVDKNGDMRANLAENNGDDALERALHRCLGKVTGDLEKMAFNTAISAMMVFVNEATKDPSKLGRSQLERFALVLAPFAPHLAEELWQMFGHEQTLAYERWPEFDPAMTREAEIEMPVLVNGKVRARITVPVDAGNAAIEKAAMEDSRTREFLAGKEVKQVIVVPGRLVNIVAR
jgi:leucyl-tRNA synthetase